MIVDDNCKLQVFGGILEFWNDAVSTTLSGALAFNAIRTTMPNIIGLDKRMRDIGVYVTCNLIRSNVLAATLQHINF